VSGKHTKNTARSSALASPTRTVRQPRRGSQTDRGKPPAPDVPPETLAVEEASMRHEGEWVLMRITAYDERHQITHGQVLFHSPSRKAISKQMLRAHQEDPSVCLYVFPSGTRRVTVEEWRECIKRAMTEEYVNVRW
jgi:hypothetical protein